MKKSAIALLVTAFLFVAFGRTQDQPDSVSPAKEAATSGIPEVDDNLPIIGLTENERDPAFDRYLDVTEVGRAISGQDAAKLAELAVRMAQGEKILLRSHRSIPASVLFQKAIEIAVAERDQETLNDLAETAKQNDDKALAAKVGAARKLASASRAPIAALQLTVTDASLEQFAALKGILKIIAAAKLTNDRTELELLKKEIPSDVLTGVQKGYVVKQIAEAVKAMPTNDHPANAALRKLTAASRDFGLPVPTPVAGAIIKYGKYFDPSSGQTLIGQAVDEARGRTHVPVYFQNNTSRPLTVVMMYQWKVNYGGLHTRIRKIPPYKKQWIVNNYGQTFLYLARDDQGRKWHGSVLRTFTSNGRRYTRPFRRVDMGHGWRRYSSWTVPLRR